MYFRVVYVVRRSDWEIATVGITARIRRAIIAKVVLVAPVWKIERNRSGTYCFKIDAENSRTNNGGCTLQ